MRVETGGIETGNRSTAFVEHSGILIDSQAEARSDVAREERQGVEGGLLDGAEAWIGLVLRVA